jgi:hypothetical protein
MITKRIKPGFLFAVMLTIASCKPDYSDDEIPYVPFADIVINLNLPENYALQSAGGFKLVNDGGVKGIILYHYSGETYYAFERNCSYHPNDACSTVDVDVSGLRLVDSCCGSIFDFEGKPVNGPAWRPLRRYVTHASIGQVTITDEIVN